VNGPGDALACAAAIGSVASFVPQLVAVFRDRSVAGVSSSMYAIAVVTFALWTGYGWMIGAWPLIVSNAASLALALLILAVTLSRRRRDSRARRAA
jgi:MtN3 and saliva related transmembrane protein